MVGVAEPLEPVAGQHETRDAGIRLTAGEQLRPWPCVGPDSALDLILQSVAFPWHTLGPWLMAPNPQPIREVAFVWKGSLTQRWRTSGCCSADLKGTGNENHGLLQLD